jgi:hypothetical protein
MSVSCLRRWSCTLGVQRFAGMHSNNEEMVTALLEEEAEAVVPTNI